MKNIVSGTDMKKVDAYTINQIGIPSLVLMERASISVAECIMKKEPVEKSVLVVASTGNNGADGLAVSRMLYLAGYDTCLYILGDKSKGTAEFKEQLKICENLQIPEIGFFDNRDIIVDAMFGVGLSRDIEGVYADVIEQINQAKNTVYAVDIPSGIDADTGKVKGVAVQANQTITFGAHKIGTVLYPGAEYCGHVMVADIGFPKKAYQQNPCCYYAEEADLEKIPKRPNYSNKGTFGKVLIIAGSKDITGAAYLCAKAAFRCGAGLVRVLTVKENREVLQKLLPEAMVNVYDIETFDEKIITSCLHWCDVVAIGPGLSTGILQKKIVKMVLDTKLPTVIDADGINNISEEEPLKQKLHKHVIITPHLGEMSHLMGVKVPELAADLIKYAKKACYRFDSTCVLKDARTVITHKEQTFINLTGNAGMATAGSGDVLTGIIIGLMAVGVKLHDAAVLGPYIHGIAGDIAAQNKGKTGMMASDIMDALKVIFQ